MASTSRSSASLFVDTSSLKGLAVALRRLGDDSYAELRRGMRSVGKIVAEDAKKKARFSEQIPGSIKVRTKGGLTVSVVAGGAKAPNAAPLENKGRGHPRHPLFGNRDYWYTNSTPAFLAPAVDDTKDAVDEAVKAVIDVALARFCD